VHALYLVYAVLRSAYRWIHSSSSKALKTTR
jgi:hypothetical protein